MTSIGSCLLTYKSIIGEKKVFTVDGQVLPVISIGNVDIPYLGCLKNVLHIPNLISPQKLARELPFHFILNNDECFLYDNDKSDDWMC